MAVSPDGTTVYVSGQPSRGGGLTVAYSAATGRQRWASSYSGGDGGSVAVSQDGTTVYVAGSSGGDQGYATVAYRAATGSQLWASRYHGPANLGDACCVAASPDGTTVFVTGDSYGGRTDYDYATVAYRG
jgi:DNA-binding beta-propeller fold protein YncE